jgi:hypothetical protein
MPAPNLPVYAQLCEWKYEGRPRVTTPFVF